MIGVFTLILLITGAIDSIRNLPTTALFGSSLFFFFSLSALIFLCPVGLVAAELASTFSEEEGGIFTWVNHAFGQRWAFFTVWLQWINTIVWYPTILSFIAGTLAYLINPSLADNKLYLIIVILTVFWGLTFLALRGLRASAFFAGFCAILGMILPVGFIIGLAFYWWYLGKPLAIDLSLASIMPKWSHTQSWGSLTAIITSFLGMELAAVHVRQIKNPQHNFPKAIFCSILLILITMLLGSLAIAIVLPKNDISLVDGVMQAFTNFLNAYKFGFLIPVTAILLLLGSLGGMINWIISPAKGLLMAAGHGYLPAKFYQLNKHGMASYILITQAIMVTFLCAVFLLFAKINAIYWLFTALSTELYLIMYVMMFLAAIKLKHAKTHKAGAFTIPCGKKGLYTVAIIGLIGCFITLIVGFIPPQQTIDIGGDNYFRVIFALGLTIMVSPILFLKKSCKR
ncbi:MAG: transporter [Legionellales bacterium RIFCSPHIGHO2_12_FULL_37_14]|nr:MAG: transporter [Legionellales bacterium RIFCSPHIGHO2_12_FULL_37_14]